MLCGVNLFNIVRFGRLFLAAALLLFGSRALADKPFCPGLLPSTATSARFVSADPTRAEFVRKSLAEMDAAFSGLRKPSRLAICLVPEFREDLGLADAGFIFLPVYSSLEALANSKAVLFHEYGHHLFYLNIGRFAPAFAMAGDLADHFSASRIDLRAVGNRLFEMETQKSSADYIRLKKEYASLKAEAEGSWVMLVIGQYLVADLNEMMADVAAVLMLNDPSAVRIFLERVTQDSHDERDFAAVPVTGKDKDTLHGRLWPVRQAIGRIYLKDLDLKKRGEVYEHIMAAMGRGLGRLMEMSRWTGDPATRNRVFIEELEKR